MSASDDYLATVFHAFDLGNKGFLTEFDLNMALSHIVNHKDKIEIKNVFGVLDSSSARVNIQTFKENVLGYLQSEEHEYENSLIKEVADINDNKLLNSVYNQIENSNRISPFKPNLISSPIIGHQPHHSLHEETFESLGEECSNIHNLEEVDCTVRSSRLIRSFNGIRRLSRKHSFLISESPSPMGNEDRPSLEINIQKISYNDDLECLKRELLDKTDQILLCQEELQNESQLVRTLEEKLENLINNNKELIYELDNSKINNKNLEAHMLFLEEKFLQEGKNIENQKLNLAFDKEKLVKDKENLNREKLNIDHRYEELESLKIDLVSKNHIIQAEVLELRIENKNLKVNLETLKKFSEDKINELIIENTTLKVGKPTKNVREYEIKVCTSDAQRSGKPKRDFLLKILLKILIKSGFICIHECFAYLRG